MNATLNIERILCPIDFSEFSEKAYDYAQALARHCKAKLFLAHVVQPLTSSYPYYAFPDAMNEFYWNLRARAEQQLQQFAKAHTRNGVEAERVVQEGTVTESILTLAQKQRADLIVMGTHGWQGADRLILGSVTEKVLRKACCPVLAVRKPAHDFVNPREEHDPVRLSKILFCSDFSENSDRALKYALSLGMEFGAELTLLHVLENIPASSDLQSVTAAAKLRLETAIPSDAHNRCKINSAVRIGKAYQEIIQLSLKDEIDLAVLGVRGRNALHLAMFGSTTYRVIQLGLCPVLAVHV